MLTPVKDEYELIEPYSQEHEILLRWYERYGYNPHGLVSVLPGSRAWIDPHERGAVSYLPVRNTWLANDPFASEDNLVEVTRGFLHHARSKGKLAAFIPATERFARLAGELRLDAVPIGVSPYFDIGTWAPRGNKAKHVRAGVNQSRRAGLYVEEVVREQISRAEVAKLCQAWIETRRSIPFGWVFALDPLRFGQHKRFFVARDVDGQMMGLLAASPIPARDGWYLEDVLRHPETPTGTSDLLVVESLGALRLSGARLATLGTVIGANLELGQSLYRGRHFVGQKILASFGNRMEAVYNFDGLRRFKAKFCPSWWEPEYVLFPAGVSHPARLSLAVARAIAPGGIWSALWNSSWR